jgi:hypothetical protein
MKRDMDLAREILLKIEDKSSPNESLNLEDELAEHSVEEIMYHVKLLAQADLVEATDESSHDGIYWIAEGLTWKGHEFLDAVRNDTVWNDTKEIVKQKGGSIAFDVLKSLALQVAAKHFGL